MKAYHLSKFDHHQAGDFMVCKQRTVVVGGDLALFADEFHQYWPRQLSNFGYDCTQGIHGSNSRIAIIEMFLETIRSKGFPDKPSRFQAFFASDSIDQAKRWHSRLLKRSNPSASRSLWLVESDEGILLDAGWLDYFDINNVSWPLWTFIATQYWKGVPFKASPWPELLLPSFRFIEQLDSLDSTI